MDPNLLGTSSIDTTCTVWGLETDQMLGRVTMVSGHVKTQLIAHDKEVGDVGVHVDYHSLHVMRYFIQLARSTECFSLESICIS